MKNLITGHSGNFYSYLRPAYLLSITLLESLAVSKDLPLLYYYYYLAHKYLLLHYWWYQISQGDKTQQKELSGKSKGYGLGELNKQGDKNGESLGKRRELGTIPRFSGVVRSWISVEALGKSLSFLNYGDNKNRTAKL